jgi:hypothetical protein
VKIFGKFLILLLPILLFGAKATVDRKVVYIGDSVTLSITSSGGDVKFPQIDEIDGNIVQSVGSSKSMTYINGKVTNKITKNYIFTPSKSLTIPSFSVEVDGKKEETEPIEIKVSKVTPTNSKNDKFSVRYEISKNELRVGEPLELKVIFKRDASIEVADIQSKPPSFNGFWVKDVKQLDQKIEGNYVIHEIRYLLFAQKSGKINIDPIRIDIGRRVRDNNPLFMLSFDKLKFDTIYSQNLEVNVLPLPNGVELYGEYDISSFVDKSSVNEGEAVNLTIKIDAYGNVDDIKSFNLDIENATVYSEEPKTKSFIKDGKVAGEFVQKFAIMSNENFIVPPFDLEFFSSKSSQLKSIKTKEIKINVVQKRAPTSQNPQQLIKKEISPNNAQKTKTIKEFDTLSAVIWYLAGFLSGIFLLFLVKLKPSSTKETKESSLQQKIKKSKSDKELLTLLLSQKKDVKLSQIIEKLEENCYKNGNNTIDKKEILKLIDKLNSSKKPQNYDDRDVLAR